MSGLYLCDRWIISQFTRICANCEVRWVTLNQFPQLMELPWLWRQCWLGYHNSILKIFKLRSFGEAHPYQLFQVRTIRVTDGSPRNKFWCNVLTSLHQFGWNYPCSAQINWNLSGNCGVWWVFCVYNEYRMENRHRHDETIGGMRQVISCFAHGCGHCEEPIYRIVQEDRSIDFNELQIVHAMRLNWIIFSLSKFKVTRTRTVRRYLVLWLSVQRRFECVRMYPIHL